MLQAFRLTGPERRDWHKFAEDFSAALGRKITYVPTTMEDFREQLRALIPQLPEHPARRLENLALQNGGDRYIAEVTGDVELLLGRPATPIRPVIEAEAWRFEKDAPDQLQHRDLRLPAAARAGPLTLPPHRTITGGKVTMSSAGSRSPPLPFRVSSTDAGAARRGYPTPGALGAHG